jgi:hypothetical protein
LDAKTAPQGVTIAREFTPRPAKRIRRHDYLGKEPKVTMEEIKRLGGS